MPEEGVDVLGQLLRANVPDLLGKDDLLVEAFREFLKDEVKSRIREEIARDPDVKRELTDAVRMYYEARVRESYAALKLAKASARLGVDLMPRDLRDDLGKEVVSLIEKEVAGLLDKAL